MTSLTVSFVSTDFYLQEGISQGLSPSRHARQLHEGGSFMMGATFPVLNLGPRVVLTHSKAHKYLLSDGMTEGSHSNTLSLVKLLSNI